MPHSPSAAKTIRNSMSSNGFDKSTLDEAYEACGIAPTARAESLATDQFVELASALSAGESGM